MIVHWFSSTSINRLCKGLNRFLIFLEIGVSQSDMIVDIREVDFEGFIFQGEIQIL